MALKIVNVEHLLSRPRRPERYFQPGDNPFTEFMPETFVNDLGFWPNPTAQNPSKKRRYQSAVNVQAGIRPSYWFQSR